MKDEYININITKEALEKIMNELPEVKKEGCILKWEKNE